MSKSPEFERKARLEASGLTEAMARDLGRERRVRSDEQLLDRELAADRELRHQLASLRAPSIPKALRQKAMDHAVGRRSPMAWMAMAAVIVMSLIAVVALQTRTDSIPMDAHQPTTRDWADLQLALNTLDVSGRRVAEVTEREVRVHLNRTHLEVSALPDSNKVWSWFPPSVQSIR